MPKDVECQVVRLEIRKYIVLEEARNVDIGLDASFRKYSVARAILYRYLDRKNYFSLENTQLIGSVERSPHIWKRN